MFMYNVAKRLRLVRCPCPQRNKYGSAPSGRLGAQVIIVQYLHRHGAAITAFVVFVAFAVAGTVIVA